MAVQGSQPGKGVAKFEIMKTKDGIQAEPCETILSMLISRTVPYLVPILYIERRHSYTTTYRKNRNNCENY